METLATCINRIDAFTTEGAIKTNQKPVSKRRTLTLSNATPGSALAAKANLASRCYTLTNISERMANECNKQTAKFTVCQIKHCTTTEQHYKLLLCFKAGQSEMAEVFAIHAAKGLLDSTETFPDLTKGYTFESPHATFLSAPTFFTSPEALRKSAEALVELYRLDEQRRQNLHENSGREEIIACVMEQYRADGGILRKPSESDEAWAIEFERPGSDIMQRTGIDTRFYRVDDIGTNFAEVFDFSDAHVNVLPLKFVHDNGGEWIAMMCFGDKDEALAEVNVIDMDTGNLLMIDDDKEFPRLDEGSFVPIFPPGRVLRSKNKFVDPRSLDEKIQSTANYIMDAMRIVERIKVADTASE